MSAILEALKKSQAHRAQISTPAPQSHLSAIHRPAPRWRLAGLLLLLLTGGIAILIMWNSPVSDVRTTLQTPSTAENTQQAGSETLVTKPQTTATPQPQPPRSKTTPPANPAIQPVADDKPAAFEKARVIPEEKEEIDAALQQPDQSPKATVPTHRSPEPKPKQKTILQWLQLPPALRQQAAALQINVIQYNEQAGQSWVLINMHKYREGDKLEGDFYLKAIRPQSLLLQYDRFLFELPIRN